MPEERNKIRVVIDVNLWVSFAIGKQSVIIRDVVLHPMIDTFASKELIEEFKEVLQKTKLKKIISPTRRKQALSLIKKSVSIIKPKSNVLVSSDPSDDYLLGLSVDCRADYLITGDNDLLDLKSYQTTEIISLSTFVKRILAALT